MFQKAKGITKNTSNNHTEHVISNIIQRLHFEQGTENVIALQESQIKSLSAAVGPMKNTVFPQSMLNKVSEHYQAHLEQISDYLLCGPGVYGGRKHLRAYYFLTVVVPKKNTEMMVPPYNLSGLCQLLT